MFFVKTSSMNVSQLVIRILLTVALMIVIDTYAYQAIRTLTVKAAADSWKQYLPTIYWWVHGIYYAFILFVVAMMVVNQGPGKLQAWGMTILVLMFVPKLVIVVVLLGEDIVRGLTSVYHLFTPTEHKHIPSRRAFVSQAALALAAIPFGATLYGILKGKYDYRIHEQTFFFPDLPDAFDGFTITQLSDIHSGSFTDVDAVNRGIQKAQALNSDLFVFTGDLVNNKSEEAEPWIEHFGKLKSPFGQFSILGNHDYGDYVPWDSPEEKAANLRRLKDIHGEMGFRLMQDESLILEKGGDKIHLLGVQNWGAGHFAKVGDIDKALADVPADAFKILLSHDPSHFTEVVSKHEKHVHLTLSGHTHGMQFGIEIPGIRWSPVKWRYRTWAGAYEENGRKLYVNRGFGFLGFQGRVGIWPEITRITLRKGAPVVGV